MGKNKCKMTKEQKRVLKTMKKTRQIDSQVLRDLIQTKLKWAIIERKKGLNQIENIKIQINKLEGIILFIQDLLEIKKRGKVLI